MLDISINPVHLLLLIAFIKISAFISIAFVIKTLSSSNQNDTTLKYYKVYFLIPLFATIMNATLTLMEIRSPIDGLVFMFVLASFVLFLAIKEEFRKWYVIYGMSAVLVVFFASSFLLDYSNKEYIITHAIFAIVFYSVLAYIVIRRGRRMGNIGYIIMYFAFMTVVASGMFELYFILSSQLTYAYIVGYFGADAGVIILIIGFIAVQLISENKFLNKLALTDTLTGMNNRRGLEYMLQPILLMVEEDKCFSVITIDIDFFKKVNDRYGHDGGDIVLKEFSSLIKNSHRVSDISCRLGGEEFVVVLPSASKEKAMEIAGKMRRDTELLAINVDGENVSITASFGVATMCSEFNFDESLKCADKALYSAKFNGRNQVVFSEDIA